MSKAIKFFTVSAAGLMLAAGALAQTAATSAQSAPSRPDAVSQSAAMYGSFHADVTDLNQKQLSSTSDVDQALDAVGGHNPDNLSKGVIAYGAMIASQSPELRRAVREASAYHGADKLAGAFTMDPRWARQNLSGSNAAVASALGATDADGRHLVSAASMMKEKAYSLDGASWAKRKVSDASGRANRLRDAARGGRPVKSNILSAMASSEASGQLAQAGQSGTSVWSNVSSAASSIRVPSVGSSFRNTPRNYAGRQSETYDKIVALAAYRLAKGGQGNSGEVQNLMLDRKTSQCLTMGNLELQGCVSAAHDQTELAHCMSAQMKKAGTCVGEVSK